LKAPDGLRFHYQTPGAGSVWPANAGAGTTGLDKPYALGGHPWTTSIGRRKVRQFKRITPG
jgi:hypothetical protein